MRMRTFVTLAAQFSGFIVNALTLGLLSRKLGPDNYSIYVTCVAMVTIVGTFTRGNQTQVASAIAVRETNSHINLNSEWSGLAKLVGVYLVFWIALIPLFSRFSEIPLVYLFISSIIVSSAVLGSVASGVLQGLEQFEFWQLGLGAVTFLQVPLILFAIGRTLNVGYFLVVLSVPSFFFFVWVFRLHKEVLLWATSMPGKSNVIDGIIMGLFILMLQTPLVSLRHLSGETTVGSLESLCLIGIALSGLASIFGSYLLPKYARLESSDRTIGSGMKLHVIHSMPLIGLVLVLTCLGPNVLNVAFGEGYAHGIDRPLMFLATSSFITWSIAGSLLQERITKLARGYVTFLMFISILQLAVIRVFIHQPEQLFVVFFIFGVMVIFSLLYSTSKNPKIFS